MSHPEEDVDAFEFRMRDPATDEWFYQTASSWEEFEHTLISVSRHRGHPMELWAIRREDADYQEPEVPWREGDGGQTFVLPWKRIARVEKKQIDWQHHSMNGIFMGGPGLGAVEGWLVTRDGETVAGPFKSDFDAVAWMHSHTSQSIDWEVKYGGYDIILVRGGKVQDSYRRQVVEPERRKEFVAHPEDSAKEFEEEVRRAFVDVYGEPRDPAAIESSIRSSYSETARRQAWTEPRPSVVLVGTESSWIRDMFDSEEEMGRWEQVANLLRVRGWPGAWFDSISAGVHIVYWQPSEAQKISQESPELGAARARRVKPDKIPLKKAERLAREVQAWIAPFAECIEIVGSVRRRVHTVGDIELVVLPKNLESFLEILEEEGFSGGERKRVGTVRGLPIEIYIAHEPKELGGLVFMYTGDFTFNIAMRMKAKKRGLKLNQYGIWRGAKAVLQSDDEVDFFKFLGVRYHEPEERSLASRVKPKKAARMSGGDDWDGEEG